MEATQDLSFCAIGLGSNLGDSRSILDQTIDRLRSHPQLDVIAVSGWYITTPVGPPQPDYLNGCATIKTGLAPVALLQELQAIEAAFCRVRHEVWGARTLDLDLLLYDHLIIDLPILQVPHPYLCDRAFVLVPLAEIAPELIDPSSGQSIGTLCSQLSHAGVKLLS